MSKISKSAAFVFAALTASLTVVSVHAAEQQRPRLNLTMQPIDYPIEALAAAEEGTVLVELGIGVDGAVTDVVLQQSSGHPRLDDAGILAARSVKLSSPPMRGGVPVAARLPAEIIWNLPLMSAEKYLAKNLPGGALVSPDDVVTNPRAENFRRYWAFIDHPMVVGAKTGAKATVYVLIGTDGTVLDTRIAASNGIKPFNDAIIRRIKQVRFEPGKINGTPAPLWWAISGSQWFLYQTHDNCHSAPAFTGYERRKREALGEEIPRYDRWTLVNNQGKIGESLLLTERGWMSLEPSLIAKMNESANYPTKGLSSPCWLYEGLDPMMNG